MKGDNMFKNGFVKSEAFHIISARKGFDTQHIALAWSDSPMCGAKIQQAHEVPLLLGYLCDRCSQKYQRLTMRAADLPKAEQNSEVGNNSAGG
jgi:hypothetical protein